MLIRILRSPDAPETGSPPDVAQTVVTGTKSETEIRLETELTEERSRHATTAEEKKNREIRISELEDEIRTLRSVTPAPAKAKRGMMEKFLSGDDSED